MDRISTVNADRETLIGIKESSESNVHKCAILVHGFGYNKEEGGIFTDLAKILTKIGYTAYYFDFSGCGESEGNFIETTPSKLIDDLRTIISYAKNDSDPKQVLVIAQSYGGPLTIALKPEVDMMILLGAFADPYNILSRLFGENFNRNGVSVLHESDGSVTKVSKEFWDDLERIDILESVRKIGCPIHYIHGGCDDIVPTEQMQMLYEASNNATKTIIPGNDHGMQPDRDMLYKRIVHLIREISS